MTSSTQFLHAIPEFPLLLQKVARQRAIDPFLAEKDYWLMHCLWGLQQQGWSFQMKIGTTEYHAHKQRRFPKADNQHIASNDAFRLSDPVVRARYETKYRETAALYYAGQVPFAAILERITQNIDRL